MSSFIPDLTTEEGQKERLRLYNQILDEQFDISYYVKGISFADSDNMASFERKEIYNRLIKRRNEEREAIAQSRQSAMQLKKFKGR